MFLLSHTGTLMDVSPYFSPKSQTIDQILIDRFLCRNWKSEDKCPRHN